MADDSEEGYLNMEDAQARDTVASEGAPDPGTDQGKTPNKEGTGYSAPDGVGTGGDDASAGSESGGGVSQTGGSTGEGGGASQGGGTGN